MKSAWILPVSFAACGALLAAVLVVDGSSRSRRLVLLVFVLIAGLHSPLAFPRSVGALEAQRRSAVDGRPVVYWRAAAVPACACGSGWAAAPAGCTGSTSGAIRPGRRWCERPTTATRPSRPWWWRAHVNPDPGWVGTARLVHVTPGPARQVAGPLRPTGVSRAGVAAGPYPWRIINGAHIVVHSRDAEADRDFFRNVLEYPHVDAGGSWLIFKLPPAEVAVHPMSM